MKTKKELLLEEFTWDKIRLTHKKYIVFYQSQWQIGEHINPLFVIFRIILALIFLVLLIISIIDLNDLDKSADARAKWLIYLTNWQFFMCTLQAIIGAYMVTSMFVLTRKNRTTKQETFINKKLCIIYWAFYTIAINGALFVSVVYWTMVYDEKRDTLSVVNLFTHAINAILLLIDCFLAAHPIRLLHFYLPLMFNLIYVIFSIIYYNAGGTDKHGFHYVYAILNWAKPISTIKNIAFVCVFALILHLFIYFYVCLRKYIAKLLSKHEKNIELSLSNLGQLMSPLKDGNQSEEDTTKDTPKQTNICLA